MLLTINKISMKRVPIILLLSGVFAAGMFLACNKKKDYPVDIAPAQAHFNNNSIGSYYIKNDPNSTFKIPVGVTNLSNSSRNITVTVTTTTGATSAQYSVPSTTVTIPAGKAVDSITVKGLFSGYAVARIDTLVFTITGGDVTPSDYNKTFKLVLRKYCDVVLSNFLGVYANSYDDDGGGPYGPYTTTVTAVNQLTPSTGTITIANASDAWMGVPPNPIVVGLDWTDPANFKTTIAAQIIYSGNFYGYGALTITGVGTGTFSSCDNTIKLNYKMTVGAGSFGGVNTVMAR